MAVYSKTGSLSYFPLFVLHHVAELSPLAIPTKKRNYRYQTASCYEIDILFNDSLKRNHTCKTINYYI